MLKGYINSLVKSAIFSQNSQIKSLDFDKVIIKRVRDYFLDILNGIHINFTYNKDLIAIDGMNGRDFEFYIAGVFKGLGYKVRVTKGSGDQGVDVLAKNSAGETFAIQTKRYSGSVGNRAIQEAISGRIYYGCTKAMVVTNSTFTNSAVSLAAKDGNVLLIDRHELKELINKAQYSQSIQNSK